MTPAQRKAKYEKLRERLDAARLAFEKKEVVIRAEMKALTLGCDHPNGYRYTCMGDPGFRCPDCGYDR
jgi:hypothetical protein